MKKKIVWLPYDMDTAIGINNEGALVFSYNLEDIDTIEGGADVFNGQKSVLWQNIRACFYDELKSMYQTLRSKGVLSYDVVEKMFEDHQAKWPEAIFNEDAVFKYIDPLIDDGTASYLPMLQGSKAEQRKWWLYNRFRYLDSKYNAGDALSDIIQIRGYAKADVTVTPYADIYPAVKYGSYLMTARGQRNKPTTLVCPLDNVNDTEIYIYSASQLKSVGDLSGLMVGFADFSLATKIQNLKIGDKSASYSNGNLTELDLGNNTLLKMIDVRNCPALTQAVNLRGCVNIEEAYFDGTSVTGLGLPDGGVLKVLHLPSTVTNLTILNQTALTDFSIPSYGNISTLRLENVSGIDTKAVLKAIPASSRVRLIGFTWECADADEISSLMDILDTMRGLDENGGNMEKAQVSGTIHTVSLKGSDIATFNSRYPYLTIKADHTTSSLYYYNHDGSVLLYTETIRDGGDGGAYTGRPERAATAANSYTFIGWSKKKDSVTVNADALKGIVADRRVYAAYSIEGRTYTIRFYNGTTLLQESPNIPYGGGTSYTGAQPVKTETDYPDDYEFIGWSPVPEKITGDTNCYAQYRYIGFVSLRLIENSLSGSYENDTVTKIGRYALAGDTELTSASFTAVTEVAGSAFNGCNGLESVNMPEVVTISESGFAQCRKLRRVTMPKVKSLGMNAFSQCSALETFDMSSVESIGSECFYYCTNIKTLTFGDSIKSVGYGAFRYCSELKGSVTFGKNLVTIQGSAFYNTGVTEVHFKNKPTDLNSRAFDGAKIRDIYVPWAEGEVSGAPWGATGATVHYNTPVEETT